MEDEAAKTFWLCVSIAVLLMVLVSAGTRLCVPAPSASDPASYGLNDLANLKIGKSSTTPDLLNVSFWNEVGRAYGNTFLQIVPNTALGLVNSSTEWREWLLENSASVPPWMKLGLRQYLDDQLFLVRSAALATGNASASAALIKQVAALAACA